MEIKIGDNDMTDQNNKLVIFQNKHKRNSQILLNKSLNHFGTSSAPLASDVDGEFKIELQSSIKIIVPSNFDDEQLLRLLNLLNSNIGINNAAAK